MCMCCMRHAATFAPTARCLLFREQTMWKPKCNSKQSAEFLRQRQSKHSRQSPLQMFFTLMLKNACSTMLATHAPGGVCHGYCKKYCEGRKLGNTNASLMAVDDVNERPFTLGGLDLSLGSVVWHGDGDDYVQGKELGVKGALGCHIDLRSH